MNEKQVKLLRYFVKHSKQLQTAGQIKAMWPYMDHKTKGKTTKFLKKVIVTNMAVQAAKAKARAMHNESVLKGFTK